MDDVPSLPDDIIFSKILPRLPSLALLKCKFVCKLWHKTISLDKNFAKTQLMFQEPGCIDINYSILSFTNSKENFDIDLAHIHNNPHLVPMNSCNGLLVVGSHPHNHTHVHSHDYSYDEMYDQGFEEYFVINPIIQRHMKLPRSPMSFGHCILYFDSNLSKYKLVGWNNSWDPKTPNSLCMLVLDVNVDKSKNCWSSFQLPSNLYFVSDRPVVFNGWLHWIADHTESNKQKVILACNAGSKEFREIEIPKAQKVDMLNKWDSHVVGTKESFYCLQHHYLSGSKSCYIIWSAKDYKNQIWTMIYRYKAETCTHCEESPSNSFGSAAPFDIEEVISYWSKQYVEIAHINSFIWLDNKLE